MLNEYVPVLEEKKIKFTFDDKSCDYLAGKAYGGTSGARDLRNLIRREVEDKIAQAMIDSGAMKILGINLTAEDDKLVLQTV